MILAISVFIGLIAGVVRARITHSNFDLPDLRFYGLAIVGFLPQYLVFYTFVGTNSPDWIASSALIFTQAILVIFVLVNRKQPGFALLGTGLALNLIVILLNGGFMPISPENVYRLLPNVPPYLFQIGDRFGSGKDMILPVAEMRLPLLSDRFLLPGWSPYQVAFSFGDLLLAIGMLMFFWKTGGPSKPVKELS